MAITVIKTLPLLLMAKLHFFLSAKLADLSVLEIFPISALISVEMDAFLITDDERLQVYSSHKRLNLTQQRLAK